MNTQQIEQAYEIAKQRYAELGIDTDKALDTLQNVQISLHCWQADDVAGFESSGDLTGGIQVNGKYALFSVATTASTSMKSMVSSAVRKLTATKWS